MMETNLPKRSEYKAFVHTSQIRFAIFEIIDADLGDADISDTNTDGATDGTTSAVSAENEEDEDIDLSTFLSDSDSFEDSDYEE